MGRIGLFIIAMLIVAAPSFAHEDLPVYRMTLSSPEDVQRLEAAGCFVDAVMGDSATVYVPKAAQAAFMTLGLKHTAVPEPAQEKGGGYHTYATLTSHLQQLAAEHPEITRLRSLGESVEGRELWALLVTDNPDAEEDEPEFKYVATMHGDEPVGTELIFEFLEELLGGYGGNIEITTLVNETAMWFVPCMNPDGLEDIRRTNANGADLNRSFPFYPNDFETTVFEEEASTQGRQPEVRHVMEWSLANSFVLAANFHGGSVVVNYPFDFEPGVPSGAYARPPDDAVFRSLSHAYADLNREMSNSIWFEDGITNGSAWYSIQGGMQDWNYRFLGCLELTIELSSPKRPSASQLPEYWDDNRESMWAYLRAVHRGVRGLVTDRVEGTPLWCEVRVEGNAQPVFADPDVGDYHRILLPGSHTLNFFAPGYFPYRVANVGVGSGETVRSDVALSDGDINGDGTVNAMDIQLAVSGVLGSDTGYDADVNGGGVTATDVQGVINVALGRGVPEP